MEKSLTKKDLAQLLAAHGLSKAEAAEAVSEILEAFTDTLKDGGSIDLYGFGKFSVSQRSARAGYNPATGEKIEIPASRTVKFRPARGLKEQLQVR